MVFEQRQAESLGPPSSCGEKLKGRIESGSKRKSVGGVGSEVRRKTEVQEASAMSRGLSGGLRAGWEVGVHAGWPGGNGGG